MVSVGIIVGGAIFILLGIAFIATIIGAIIGIPFLIIGIFLVVRGATYTPPKPQQQVVYVQQPPVYFPPPPVAVVEVPVQTPPLRIMRRCEYCQTVFPESDLKCPSCGASF